MFLLPASDLYVLLEDAPLAAPEDVLVLRPPVAAAAYAPDLTAPGDALAPSAEPAPSAAPMPAQAVAPPPGIDLPAEDSAVSLAAPDALPVLTLPADALAPSPAAPSAEPASAVASVTAEAVAPAPAFDPPPEDAFPSLAALDAILAAHAGPPQGPDAAERAEAAALLGLDPAIATDADLYAGIIANLPDPDADATLEIWLSEAEAGTPPPEWPEPAGDWQVG